MYVSMYIYTHIYIYKIYIYDLEIRIKNWLVQCNVSQPDVTRALYQRLIPNALDVQLCVTGTFQIVSVAFLASHSFD